jgi:hypothetical protein
VLEKAAAGIALYGASHRIVAAVFVRLLLLLPSGGSVRVRYWLRWRCGMCAVMEKHLGGVLSIGLIVNEVAEMAVSELVAEPEERRVVEMSSEILRGVGEIAAFLGVHRKTVTKAIKAGLPVAPLGLGLATTKRLALEWFEKQVGG